MASAPFDIKFLEDNNINSIKFLHNNSYLYENYIIAGTRGWDDSNSEDDISIIAITDIYKEE